jgi:hypothetical protein
MFCGDTNPCFTKASINIPPIFPAPRTASRMGVAECAIPLFPFRLIQQGEAGAAKKQTG